MDSARTELWKSRSTIHLVIFRDWNQPTGSSDEAQDHAAGALQSIRPHILLNIQWLEKRLVEIDAHLNRTIRNCPAWRHKDDPLRSEPCVGKVLSFTLQTDLPELGIRGHRRISVLVGVAPLYRDSGDFTGAPRVWGGRSKVRHVLHMATVAAIRYDAVIRSFHGRLIRAGEKAKISIVAAMHKLLVILNAMVKNDTAWRRMAAGV